jgi:iron complex outermembrane receptor protein
LLVSVEFESTLIFTGEFMFKRNKICTAALAALGGTLLATSLPVLAQGEQRVEITGSAIKRIDAETAVPVTVLRVEELRRQGITTVEQIVMSISAGQVTTGTSQVVGSGSGGASFADLRGIGANKTLVLLNGRRVANNAYDSSAPDLNMIPFATIERVEVLRDGASALYGTDAVGGVINFITRKDFTGGTITLGADRPQEDGGKASQVNVGFGYGDLSTTGFNIFGFFDVNKQDRIEGTQRPFNARQPGGLSPTPFPANYYQDGAVVGNPSAPGCTDPFLIPAGDGTSCIIATSPFVNYTPESDRVSAMLRGSLALGSDHTLSAEWFGTRNEVQSLIAPVPYGVVYQNRLRPDGTPNPFFPGNPGSTVTPAFPIDPTFTRANMNPTPGVTLDPGFVIAKWRDMAHGQRTDSTDNEQQRFVLQLEGVAAGWDYQAAATYNSNEVAQNVSGYSDGNMIYKGMAYGVLNPYGPQDAGGQALIDASGLSGNLQNAKGTVTGVDARMSRELADWFGAGRKSALAIGGEFRKEEFWQAANTPFAEKVAASTGIDPTSVAEGERDVWALYAELDIPLMKNLDLTAALRFDDYSDFGNSTNPKLTLRYQPMSNLLLRGTYSTGFRAPSLYEINSTPYFTNTPTSNDPLYCPGGVIVPGKAPVFYCGVQFQALYGGNTDLEPEEATNYTIGVVFDATKNLSFGADLWWVKLENQIGSITSATVLGDPATFDSLIIRDPSGNLPIDSTVCPGPDCGYLDLRTQNLGGLNANGIDLFLTYGQSLGSMGRVNFSLNSTYIDTYEYQDYTNGPWNQNVGVFVGSGPIFKWKHAAAASWAFGDWMFGGAAYYKSGYTDQDPVNTVSSYATLDAYVRWEAMKGLGLTFGIANLTDRDPPYSNQQETFQANYDPRFTDPTGRKFYIRGTYQF